MAITLEQIEEATIIALLTNQVNTYNELPEEAKIPLRIMMAQKQAQDDMRAGKDLKCLLNQCVKDEYYCGAEGIKRVIEEHSIL